MAEIPPLVERMRAEFPQLPADVVLRQVLDAHDAVALFGVDAHSDREGLVERLARSHLEGLAGYTPEARS